MPTKLEKELLALAAAERGCWKGVSPPNPLESQPLYTAAFTAEENSPLANDHRGGLVDGARMNCVMDEPIRRDFSVEELSRLFMGSEAQAQLDIRSILGRIMNVDWGSDEEPVSDAFDIEFDSEFEAATAPNEAVRFQVGRESPPHIGVNPGITYPYGRVVSRRGEDGRFRPTGTLGEGGSSVTTRLDRNEPSQTSPVNRVSRSAESQSRAVRPTALERLMGKSPFDDD